jgi:ubiquinone/menaquinone biosynthesis C-methylase UbiE
VIDHGQKSRTYYDRRARKYDWANRFAAFLRGTSPTRERRKAVRRLRLKPGDRVLEVCVGTGTNIPLMGERAERLSLVGLDISRGMLAVCADKLARLGITTQLIEGSAERLPFRDESFDAVLHHGGIAEFGDKQTAINEMFRVVQREGRVLICDVGIHEDGTTPLMNGLLLLLQPKYAAPPPMNLLPASAKDVHLSWFFRNSWYMIELTKP